MDELKQEYGDRIDFLKYNVTEAEGNCEYNRQAFTDKIPAMMYVDATGKIIATTDMRLEKEDLRSRLEALLR